MKITNTDRICAQVFARISASISHEIKNTLSIINENAGLLDDFALMAGEDEGVAVERVRLATGTIAKQVERSNLIMKNLNRFAHSADSYLAQADLKEVLGLIVELTGRQAAMKNISTSLDCLPGIALSTYLIVFESLIYLTILSLFQLGREGTTLVIEAKSEERNISICFTIEQSDESASGNYPDQEQSLLLEQLQASFRHDDNRLHLLLPAGMDQRIG